MINGYEGAGTVMVQPERVRPNSLGGIYVERWRGPLHMIVLIATFLIVFIGLEAIEKHGKTTSAHAVGASR